MVWPAHLTFDSPSLNGRTRWRPSNWYFLATKLSLLRSGHGWNANVRVSSSNERRASQKEFTRPDRIGQLPQVAFVLVVQRPLSLPRTKRSTVVVPGRHSTDGPDVQ